MCVLNKCKLKLSQIHLTHSWCCKMLDKYCKAPVKYFGRIPSCIQLIDNASGFNSMKYWQVLLKRLQQQLVNKARRASVFSFGSKCFIVQILFPHWFCCEEKQVRLEGPSWDHLVQAPCAKQDQLEHFWWKMRLVISATALGISENCQRARKRKKGWWVWRKENVAGFKGYSKRALNASD